VNDVKLFLRDIRVEHTLFALPFAYVGAVMAATAAGLVQLLWITLAVVGARTAAMRRTVTSTRTSMRRTADRQTRRRERKLSRR